MSTPTTLPARLDEDTLELLHEHGLTDEEIARLQRPAAQRATQKDDAEVVEPADEGPLEELPEDTGDDRGVAQDWTKGEGGLFTGSRPQHTGYQGVRIVHHGPDPDPYGEQMDAEAATRQDARTSEDQAAIDTYQSQAWLGVNDPLRAGKEPPADYQLDDGAMYHDVVGRLDRMMTAEGGLPHATDLWRGVSSDYVFPASDMTGTTFRDLGYISTTANKDVAEAFSFPGGGLGGSTIVRIRAAKGTPAVLAESEIILAHGTALHIVSDSFGHDSGYLTNAPTGFESKVKRVITAEVVR